MKPLSLANKHYSQMPLAVSYRPTPLFMCLQFHPFFSETIPGVAIYLPVASTLYFIHLSDSKPIFSFLNGKARVRTPLNYKTSRGEASAKRPWSGSDHLVCGTVESYLGLVAIFERPLHLVTRAGVVP
jgi:hypothetical protein